MFNKRNRIPRYYESQRRLTKSNSFTPQSRRQNGYFGKFKKIFFLILIMGGIIFFLYSMLFSDFFTIKEIVISNKNFENETLSGQIKETIQTSIDKNIFFADTDELESKILNSFPELEEIAISKDFPSTLVIEFLEYPLVANIINESNIIKKSYIINSIGYAIKENLEDPNLPYIKIKTDEPVNPKEAVIEKTKLSYIIEAKTYFEDKFGMRVISMEYKPVAREIHLLTERNFNIWLDIQTPYEEQFKKLKKAIVKLNIFKENLEYIDLRIAGESGDKIIYKRAK